jgi:hypothetical protein
MQRTTQRAQIAVASAHTARTTGKHVRRLSTVQNFSQMQQGVKNESYSFCMFVNASAFWLL